MNTVIQAQVWPWNNQLLDNLHSENITKGHLIYQRDSSHARGRRQRRGAKPGAWEETRGREPGDGAEMRDRVSLHFKLRANFIAQSITVYSYNSK